MDLWQSTVSERNDILLFNEIFRPLRPRVIHPASERESICSATSAIQEPQKSDDPSCEDVDDSTGADLLSSEKVPIMGRYPRHGNSEVIGRERFIARLAKLMFDKQERLIKVYGAEGSGKTAVALEFVQSFRDKFPGGIIWLNGSTMAWDTSYILVNELHLQSYVNVLEMEHLRQRLWKYLYDNQEPWLVVLDDAVDEALEWIPPPSMIKNGFFLTTSKSKSGRDESLRVELPLLSAKSLSDLVLRFAKLNSCKPSTISMWTDSFHLCRNLLGIRLIGLLSTTYGISLEDLLKRYDAASRKSIMPNLGNILERYKLSHHVENLENIGVLDTMDFVRGRPWTAFEGLSRRELYLFERIQENLHRSRNRLSLKIICKLWRDILSEDSDDSLENAGKDLWELLRVCSFFNSRYIPVNLIRHELKGAQLALSHSEEYGNLVDFSQDGSFCIQGTLLDAIRAIHQKNTEKNRTLGKRVLTILHNFCMENVFPSDQKFVGIAECDDRAFRTSTMSLLPHIFLAVGLLSELLLKEGSDEGERDRDALPDDFLTAQIARRHSLFSVASGASVASAVSTTSSIAPGPENAGSMTPRLRRTSSFVSSSSPIIKQIAKRFTSKGKRANVRILLADLHVVQGLLLMVTQLGGFRMEQAEALLCKALVVYGKFDERSLNKACRVLIGMCLAKQDKLQDAALVFEEVLDVTNDLQQRAFILTSLAMVHAVSSESKKALPILEEAQRIAPGDLVGARAHIAYGSVLKADGQLEDCIDMMKSALSIFDDLCPLSFMSAETHKFLSRALLLQDDLQNALAHIEEAISIYSSTEDRIIQLSEAHSTLGALYESSGDLSSAVQAYSKCLDHSDKLFDAIVDNPDNLTILESLAECYSKIGKAELCETYRSQSMAMHHRLDAWTAVYSSLDL